MRRQRRASAGVCLVPADAPVAQLCNFWVRAVLRCLSQLLRGQVVEARDISGFSFELCQTLHVLIYTSLRDVQPLVRPLHLGLQLQQLALGVSDALELGAAICQGCFNLHLTSVA